jgi:hypothetical protein
MFKKRCNFAASLPEAKYLKKQDNPESLKKLENLDSLDHPDFLASHPTNLSLIT